MSESTAINPANIAQCFEADDLSGQSS